MRRTLAGTPSDIRSGRPRPPSLAVVRDPIGGPAHTAAVVASVVAIVLGATACGNSDDREAVDDAPAATAATAAPTAASGSTDPDASAGDATGCTPGPLPIMCMSFDLAGDVELRADGIPASTPSALTCADWAAGGGEFAGPEVASLPFPDQVVDGKVVAVLATVTGYTGPGTYGTDRLIGLGDAIGVSIDADAFEATSSSSATVTIDASGGGSLTFDGLARVGAGDGAPAMSGTISWTCEEGS